MWGSGREGDGVERTPPMGSKKGMTVKKRNLGLENVFTEKMRVF